MPDLKIRRDNHQVKPDGVIFSAPVSVKASNEMRHRGMAAAPFTLVHGFVADNDVRARLDFDRGDDVAALDDDIDFACAGFALRRAVTHGTREITFAHQVNQRRPFRPPAAFITRAAVSNAGGVFRPFHAILI